MACSWRGMACMAYERTCEQACVRFRIRAGACSKWNKASEDAGRRGCSVLSAYAGAHKIKEGSGTSEAASERARRGRGGERRRCQARVKGSRWR
eukprot:6211049-Pleurochrysis_carterae.AAC.2